MKTQKITPFINGIKQGLGFFSIVLIVGGIIYATTGYQDVPDVTTGSTLTSSGYNQLLANVRDLNTRVTSISSSNNNLVKEIIVGGTCIPSSITTCLTGPITSIDFTGLDGNTAGGYEMVCEVVNATTSSQVLYLYVNDNFSSTNYSHQYLQGNGTTYQANRQSNPIFTYMGPNDKIFSDIKFSTINNVFVGTFNSTYYSNQQDTGSLMSFNGSITSYNLSISNITKLTVKSSAVSSIGVGSVLRLYKRK